MEITDLLSPAFLTRSLTYHEYSNLVEELYEKGRTTNDDNTESQLNYTRLSIQRMNRWERKAILSEELISELTSIERPQIWLVLTEGWCGDAGQILPFIKKMSAENDLIELKLLLRDQNDEVMDQFLTNGSRSIPKLIIIDKEELEVLATWGPRPKIFQEEYLSMRADPEIENAEASKNLHLWYARDKGREIQKEITALLKSL
ncbi:thioredoxin family protein [Balneola sp. MJW-20]|uniref:thioredoxin family protein n=1 Tax=Gracilimonas aurantiaca TaxID=3234185 RepID=UPI0034652318